MLYRNKYHRFHKEAGFIGALVLGLGAIVVGAIAYFSISDPQKEVTANILPSQNTNQLAQVSITLPENEESLISNTTQTSNVIDSITSEVSKPKVQNDSTVGVTLVENIPALKNEVPPVRVVVQEVITQPVPKSHILIVEKGEQPQSSLVVAGAAHIPFTFVNLTAQGGDVEIKNLLIERKGPASDRVFVEVGVEDFDTERALNAKHQYTMKESFVIPDGETQEIVLFGNGAYDLTEYEGQVVTLALVGIEANVPVEGSLPMTGTFHTINTTLTIGSLTLTSSGLDPATNRNINLNAKGVIFSAVKATAGGQEPVKLQWFAFLQKGSIGSEDIKNVKIGVVHKDKTYLYDAIPDEDKYFTAEFNDEIIIAKGDSVEIFIQGDATAQAVNRTINFDVDSTYDFLSYGTTYHNLFYGSGGVEDGPQDEGLFSDIEGPFYNGFTHTVVPGSINSITK